MRGQTHRSSLLVANDARRGEQDHVERGWDPVRDVQGDSEEDPSHSVEQTDRGARQLRPSLERILLRQTPWRLCTGLSIIIANFLNFLSFHRFLTTIGRASYTILQVL